MLTPAQCGVIFDLDGVIVDTTQFHFTSFVKLGEELGYTLTFEQFKQLFGRHNYDIFPLLLGHPLPAEELQRLSDRKEALFREMLRGQVRALPGALALVHGLCAQGFHLAIGSSTPRPNIDMILTDLGILDAFQAIVSADDVTRGKPDPQVFLLGAERLGLPPAQCVVLEDAPAGVQAALNGGMKALGITINHPRPALSHATRVVDSLTEVGPADMLALVEDAH